VRDEEYTYSIEKIFIKDIESEEIRFSLYKDTLQALERYVPRSLDVTEGQLLELTKEAIKVGVFSKDFVKSLAGLLNH